MHKADVPGYQGPDRFTEPDRVAAEIDACWEQREQIVAGATRIDEMLAISGLFQTVGEDADPQVRRLDSATRRTVPLSSKKATDTGEPTESLAEIRAREIRGLEELAEEEGFSESYRERKEEDIDKKITEEGRKQPYLKGWKTAPTPEETDAAVRHMRRVKHIKRYGF